MTAGEAMRLDAFMAGAQARYYATHDPFADFTTSPEIAQAFGEVLGAWAAVMWESMGRPSPVWLVEAGPGRGTLMADALRVVGRVAAPFARALRVVLIETSERLAAAQRQIVPACRHVRALDEVPPGPVILLANEFLDALPIRQFVRRDGRWRERWVDGTAFVERACEDPPLAEAAEGAVRERGESALAWVRALAGRLSDEGGAALLLDYGPAESGPGDSLQALRAGRPADPLSAPGEADLTAHVDFAALAGEAMRSGAAVHGPLAQGILLARLGLFQRTDRLARGRSPQQAGALLAAAARLAEPDRMGRLFKGLAVCHPALAVPPGFASPD